MIFHLKRFYRIIYWWRIDQRLLASVSDVRTVVAFGASLGDNLLCCRILEGLIREGHGPLAMLTFTPDLFIGLPFPVKVLAYSDQLVATLGRRGPKLVTPRYEKWNPELGRVESIPRQHIIAEMAKSAGLTLPVELKALFNLTPAERAEGEAIASGKVLIQSSTSGAAAPMANKEWPIDRWQAVASSISRTRPLAQIGVKTDPLLDGVEDLRGRLSIRQTAAALASARLFVGQEGFLMHLARAVDCRSVIVLGGRTRPEQTCYPESEVLYAAVPCSPCWLKDRCDFDRKCLKAITPDDVTAAVERQLALPPLSGPGQLVELVR